MNRQRWIVIVLLVLVWTFPVTAQDRNIIDTAASNSEFSILTQALEITGLADELLADNYTLFAPTDEAFNNAANHLGMTTDELLTDVKRLREILLYHTLLGTYNSEVIIAALSPESNVYLTTMLGEELLISIDDERIFLNVDPLLTEPVAGIEVIETDILASNGVIHVINGVLIPPLEEVEATAMVRFAHFASDTPSLQVYINGILSDVELLEYPSVTGWIEFPVGTYEIDFVPTGQPLDEAVTNTLIAKLTEDFWATLPLTGSMESNTLVIQDVIGDYISTIVPNKARLTFFHGIEGAPAVDFGLNSEVIFNEVAYLEVLDNNADLTVDVPEGVYDLFIGEVNDVNTLFLEFLDFEFQANTFYFIAFIGSPDAPRIYIQSIPAEMMISFIEDSTVQVPGVVLIDPEPTVDPNIPVATEAMDPVTTIAVDDLMDDPMQFLGQRIAVEGRYTNHIDFPAFILSDRDLIDFDRETLLVLDVTADGLNFVPIEDTTIRVVGSLELLTLTEVVTDYNLIVADDVYLQFEQAPILLAESIENLEFVEPINVDVITEHPVAFVGKQVTVIGDIGESYSVNSFLFYDQDLIDLDQEQILVIAAPNAIIDLDLQEGVSANVTGTVRPFIIADIETEYGIDLDETLYASYEGGLVFVAVIVLPGN